MTKQKAASPIIGVILLVLITLILAAITGTIITTQGQQTNERVKANIKFTQLDNNHIRATITNKPRANTVNLTIPNKDITIKKGNKKPHLKQIGEEVIITNAEPGDRIIAIGTHQDSQQIVQIYQVE
jgi:flagellin-like protein